MNLVDLVPDADVLCAMEPEELGLRMLPYLAVLERIPISPLSIEIAVQAKQHYQQRQPEIDRAIREAWAWLNGAALLIENFSFVSPNNLRILSRRARQLAEEPDVLRVVTARRLPKDVLHPVIRDEVWPLFHRGKLDTAVFEAMKAVEVGVRRAACLADSDIGKALMRRAFDVDTGALTDMNAEKAEDWSPRP